MKKTILITIISLLLLGFATTMVSADPNPGRMVPFFGDHFKLTDAQKNEMMPLVSEMNDLHEKMFEVQKKMIQKQVEFGNITQAEADQRIAWMQEHQGEGPGMMGDGPDRVREHGMDRGPGMMNDCPINQ
jgi:hypothetical protein